MPLFRATHKNLGNVVEYESVTPDQLHLTTDWQLEEVGVPSAAPDAPVVVPTVYGGRRRVTKQEFLDLLGTPAVAFILTAAKQDVGVEMWVKRLDLTTPDQDGTSVDLDDPRTIGGVNQIGSALVQAGVVAAGWAEGVLNG